MVKGVIGWSLSENWKNIWIPTCSSEGVNIIFTHLEMPSCYPCSEPPPPIDQLVQVQWPAWTIPVSFSSTEQIAQPSKERQASFMKQLLLRWDCETDTHMHTSHDIIFLCVCGFFWLFLRQGTKLLSKISQWTLLLFLRTEKGKVKKEPCLSSFPSPSQPRLKTLILRMEQRWQRSRKWGLVYLPAL